MMLLNAALNMSAYLENSAMVIGLENVIFIPILKNVQTLIPSYTFHMLAWSCSKSFKPGLTMLI